LLPFGSNDLYTQLHLALQQLCVEPLHQLIFGLTLFSLKTYEVQVELTLLLFGRVS
jgi:hypothetical protein